MTQPLPAPATQAERGCVLIVMEPQPPSQEAVIALSGSGYSLMRCDDWDKPWKFRVAGPVWAVRQLIGNTHLSGVVVWHAPVHVGHKYVCDSGRHATVLSVEPVDVRQLNDDQWVEIGFDGSCAWASGAGRCNAAGNLVVNQGIDDWIEKHGDNSWWAWKIELQTQPQKGP